MLDEDVQKLRALAEDCVNHDEWYVTTAGQDMQQMLIPSAVLSLLDRLDKIGGIWLRGCGPEHVEVLAEVDGEWRVVIPSQHIQPGEAQTLSHIVEPGGIEKAPLASSH